MTIVKIFGACGVALSGIIYFKETVNYEKLKIAQVDAYIKLIEYIKNQVECFNLPIDRIIESCDREILLKCGAQNASPKTVTEIVNSTNMYLDAEIVDILTKFANEFGTVYREEQIKLCLYYIGELRAYRQGIKEKHNRERKIHLGLCVSFAASLILLLI